MLPRCGCRPPRLNVVHVISKKRGDLPMDRLNRTLTGCGLTLLLAAGGCRSTQPEVPPGRPYTSDGRQVPPIGFSSDPHPMSGPGITAGVPGMAGSAWVAPARYARPCRYRQLRCSHRQPVRPARVHSGNVADARSGGEPAGRRGREHVDALLRPGCSEQWRGDEPGSCARTRRRHPSGRSGDAPVRALIVSRGQRGPIPTDAPGHDRAARRPVRGPALPGGRQARRAPDAGNCCR